jgi:hypothetical protein
VSDPNGGVLGRQAYQAYGQVTGGQSWEGKPLLDWGELPEHIQDAWSAAAVAAAVRALDLPAPPATL